MTGFNCIQQDCATYRLKVEEFTDLIDGDNLWGGFDPAAEAARICNSNGACLGARPQQEVLASVTADQVFNNDPGFEATGATHFPVERTK